MDMLIISGEPRYSEMGKSGSEGGAGRPTVLTARRPYPTLRPSGFPRDRKYI